MSAVQNAQIKSDFTDVERKATPFTSTTVNARQTQWFTN